MSHALFVLLFYCSVVTLHEPSFGQNIPSLPEHFLIVPIGQVIQALPLFPGGAGLGELGFGQLYSWLDCAVALGVLGSLVQRVVSWVLGLLGYVVYLNMRSAIPSVLPRPATRAGSAAGRDSHTFSSKHTNGDDAASRSVAASA
jgi:hypothetical protein